jgi:hypothetical protein
LLDRLGAQRYASLSGLCTSSCRLRLHSGFDLRGHGKKCLFHIGASLGRRFEELNAKRISEFLALFGADNALRRQIGLISNQQFVDILRSISVNFMQPLFDIVEGLSVGDVIYDDDAVSAAIIGGRNRSKALLSGSIPNLKLNGLSIKLDCANFEIDTNSGNVRLRVRVVREPEQQTRLSDAGISDQEKLEEVIAGKDKEKRDERMSEKRTRTTAIMTASNVVIANFRGFQASFEQAIIHSSPTKLVKSLQTTSFMDVNRRS